MPTFQFFKNGARIAEIKGADPNQLEQALKKLSAGSLAAASEPLYGITGHVSLHTTLVNT